jgi:Cu/Ag efflux pump CusA
VEKSRRKKEPGEPLFDLGYQPVVNWVLRHRWSRSHLRALLSRGNDLSLRKLGKEFMPPLNEGTLLYMPTAAPGMSITEATRVLQIMDRHAEANPRGGSRFRQGGPGGDADRSRADIDVRDGGLVQAA